MKSIKILKNVVIKYRKKIKYHIIGLKAWKVVI